MIKIRKFTLVALALSTLAVTSILALPATASAESEEEPLSISAMTSDYGYETFTVDTSMSEPTLTVNIFNTAVQYVWQAGEGADYLAMYYNEHPYAAPLYKPTIFREVAFPAITGMKYCDPDFTLGASYNSNTGAYSEKVSAMAHSTSDSGADLYRAGRDAKYIVVGKVDNARVDGDVPTSYDKNNFVWTHGAKRGNYIRGTVSYHGYAANLAVYVPLLGYEEDYITLDGVKFYLRTGPNKCSVKASTSVNVGDFGFAYGISAGK